VGTKLAATATVTSAARAAPHIRPMARAPIKGNSRPKRRDRKTRAFMAYPSQRRLTILADASHGARGRTRTDTPVKASGPKPGASTYFATRASLKGGPLAHVAGCAHTARRTLNHAAYRAGKASSVRKVATTSPPMMATAIGP